MTMPQFKPPKQKVWLVVARGETADEWFEVHDYVSAHTLGQALDKSESRRLLCERGKWDEIRVDAHLGKRYGEEPFHGIRFSERPADDGYTMAEIHRAVAQAEETMLKPPVVPQPGTRRKRRRRTHAECRRAVLRAVKRWPNLHTIVRAHYAMHPVK